MYCLEINRSDSTFFSVLSCIGVPFSEYDFGEISQFMKLNKRAIPKLECNSGSSKFC